MHVITVRSSIWTFLIACLLATALQAQSQSDMKIAKATGSISGRITIKEKGAAGIGVGLQKTEMGSSTNNLPRAVTDENGNYKITDIVAGSYQVVFGAAAYVASDGSNQTGRAVLVGEGENIDNINFALVRGGVITGKITDVEGRPVIQQQVRLFRVATNDVRRNQQTQTTYMFRTLLTDDRGVYRFFGLEPGRYKVSVGRGDDMFNPFFFGTKVSFKEVFYPDATDQAKATVIETSEGSEAKDIDISLGRPLETFAVTGRVIDEKGQPTPNFEMTLYRFTGNNNNIELFASATSNALGEFSAEGLFPGRYGLSKFPGRTTELLPDNVTFEIVDTDLSGVTVRLTTGGSIYGTVALENDDPKAFARLTTLLISAYVQNPTNRLGGNSNVSIGADGSFRITGLPAGTAMFRIMSGTDPSARIGFLLSRIERDGLTQPRGIEIREGEKVTGVRLVFKYGNAVLRGVVNIVNGPLPAGARIRVGLTDPGNYNFGSQSASVDERGRFQIEGIPPGTYELSASVANVGSPGSVVVQRKVFISDGGTNDISVTLDLKGLKQ